MQFLSSLVAAQARRDSLLCVGLDPEPDRFPPPWRGDAARIFDFCARIVDATHPGQSKAAEGVRFGASPRAALSLASAAKARTLSTTRCGCLPGSST